MPCLLLEAALRTLDDGPGNATEKSAAAEVVLALIEDGVPVPTQAARSVWRWWLASRRRTWKGGALLGRVHDEVIRREALGLLVADEPGEELHSIAVEVLCGPAHAPHINDDEVLAIVERVRVDEEAPLIARLVRWVHDARGISAATLRLIRDRWASSAIASWRQAAVTISHDLVEHDADFVRRMLFDPAARVREEMALRIEHYDQDVEDAMMQIVNDRLLVESHRDAIAALLRAKAHLLELTDVGECPNR